MPLEPAPEVPDVPLEPEIPDVPDVPDEPELPEVPDEPAAPEVPEEPEVPDVPEVPEEPKPEVPLDPPAPLVPEVPDVATEPVKYETAFVLAFHLTIYGVPLLSCSHPLPVWILKLPDNSKGPEIPIVVDPVLLRASVMRNKCSA